MCVLVCLCVCTHTCLHVWAGTSGRVKRSTLKGLNEHWNAASAVTGSYDEKQEGDWLQWRWGGGGAGQREEASAVLTYRSCVTAATVA